ncbi:MAG: conjugal transfer protein TraX [Lachnospiraceae bacterium]|nr:conjugal transfer protein TraX [Lachnospiraceae bacterium]
MRAGVTEARGAFPPELSGFWLKCLALVCMTVDHIATLFLPGGSAAYLLGRLVGRQAFPIYCFLLAEGDRHTRSRGRYLARLAVFALLSEIPYDLAFQGALWDMSRQNVFFTLFLGELALSLFAQIRRIEARGRENRLREGRAEAWWSAVSFPGGFSAPGILAVLGVAVLAMTAAGLLGSDYGETGVLLILLFGLTRELPDWRFPLCAAILAFCWWGNWLQISALLAFFLLLPWYNGQRGMKGGKTLFYLYYPLHLLLLAGAAAWL